MTTILTITLDGVAPKLVLYHHAKSEMQTYAKIIPVEKQRVPIPKQMQPTVDPIIARQKPDENNPFHCELGCVCFIVFQLMMPCGEFSNE
jgi:hypothetical protein